MKKSFLILTLAAIVVALAFSSCGNEKKISGETAAPAVTTEAKAADTTEKEASDSETKPDDGIIKKASCAYEDAGIYAYKIILNGNAPKDGELETLFYAFDGTTGEEILVATLVTDYNVESSGVTFELHTFLDGEVYQTKRGQADILSDITFGALTRASRLVTSFTPKDGEKTEIYTVTLEELKAGKK